MNQEVVNNVFTMNSLYSTAVCQINAEVDSSYNLISKWIDQCIEAGSILDEPCINNFTIIIDKQTSESKVDNPKPDEKETDSLKEEYDGESVDSLIKRFTLLTVADLKKEMKKVGLKPRGLKRNLVKQLAEKHYQLAFDEWKQKKQNANEQSNNHSIKVKKEEEDSLKYVEVKKENNGEMEVEQGVDERVIDTKSTQQSNTAPSTPPKSTQLQQPPSTPPKSTPSQQPPSTPPKSSHSQQPPSTPPKSSHSQQPPVQLPPSIPSSQTIPSLSSSKPLPSQNDIPHNDKPSSHIPLKQPTTQTLKSSSPPSTQPSKSSHVSSHSIKEQSKLQPSTINSTKPHSVKTQPASSQPVKSISSLHTLSSKPLKSLSSSLHPLKSTSTSPTTLPKQPLSTLPSTSPTTLPKQPLSTLPPSTPSKSNPLPVMEKLHQSTPSSILHTSTIIPETPPSHLSIHVDNQTTPKSFIQGNDKNTSFIQTTPKSFIQGNDKNTSFIQTTPKSFIQGNDKNTSFIQTTANPSKLSSDDKIHSKTLELLQRVEDMKKRKGKQGVSSQITNGGNDTLSKLGSLQAAIQTKEKEMSFLQEDLTLPALTKEVEKPVDRSFISFISSPKANKKILQPKLPTVAKTDKVPPVNSSKPEITRPLPRRVPLVQQTTNQPVSSTTLPSNQPVSSTTLPSNQPSSTTLPSNQPSSTTLPSNQPSSTTLPSNQPQSTILPHKEQVKREKPEGKREESQEKHPTITQDLPKQEKKDPKPALVSYEPNGKPWYDTSNFERLMKQQEQLVKNKLFGPEIVFAEMDDFDFEKVFPGTKNEHHRGSSADWTTL